ncbi:MAG: dihydrolipoamide succinyltransferase, partial [Rhodospirillaceae bacterium]|nr:dihydrolipoamide succinyltransferase [Rhodospirillaceae bacterium]
MTVDIKVPALGESVTEAEVAKWYKQIGDAVEADEPLVELETDKVTLEVNAPAAGTLAEILAGEGAEVEVGAVLGRIDETGAGVAAAPARAAPEPEPEPEPGPEPDALLLSPAVRKLVAEHELDPAAIEGTGKDGRLLKADVEAHLAAQAAAAGEAAASEPEPTPEPAPPP